MTRARDLGDFIADGAAAELVVDTTTLVVDSTNNRVGIGTASPSQALDVVGNLTVAGGAVFNENSADVDFRVESNGNANMLFVDGGEDKVFIGHNTTHQYDAYGAEIILQIEAAGTAPYAGIGMIQNSNDADSAPLIFGKSRGTSVGSTTIVQDGDLLGRIEFQGMDGGDLETGASIFGMVDGTPGSDDMPGRLVFNTTADGANSATERMRIDSAGRVNVAATTGNEKLNVAGALGVSGASANFSGGNERALVDFTGTLARFGHVNGASGSAKDVSILSGGGEKFRFGTSGQLGIGGATYGTSGQVLTSGGSGAAPTWADAAGGAEVVRVARTSDTALTSANSGNLIDITSGTFTQTFNASSSLASGWFVYIRNSGTGDITLDPNSSETIDGLTSFLMYPGEVRLVQCDGSNLHTIVLSSFRRSFTSSGTFTRPPGYRSFTVELFGGGGGGGSGRKQSGSLNSGGAGGGGAARINSDIDFASMPASVTVTVGAGGSGGTGPTSDGSSNNGSNGGATTFGTFFSAPSGRGGAGGKNNAQANGGTKGESPQTGEDGVQGGDGNVDANGSAGEVTFGGGAGGGAGGGHTAGTQRNGGSGGTRTGTSTTSGAAAGQGNGGSTDGQDGTAATLLGYGGGGGGAAYNGNGGDGGNGAVAGGGGGGGSCYAFSLGSIKSGDGGDGGSGVANIVGVV